MKVLIVLFLSFACVHCKIYPECDGKTDQIYVATFQENYGRSFVFCDGENSIEFTCKSGFVFNSVNSKCVPETDIVYDELYSRKSLEQRSATKLLPTPPGKTARTTLSNSSTRLTPNRPIPTKKPNKPSTPRNPPTNKTPMQTASTQRSPKTTKTPTRTSSSIDSESPVFVPTPPGAQSGSSQTKDTVLTTLSRETVFTTLPTDGTTKPHSKTKTPKRTTTTTPNTTTEVNQPEPTTSSENTNELLSSIQDECRRKKAGSFADPNDCRNYYRCVRGVLNKQECPSGFGWDARSKMCTSKGCSK